MGRSVISCRFLGLLGLALALAGCSSGFRSINTRTLASNSTAGGIVTISEPAENAQLKSTASLKGSCQSGTVNISGSGVANAVDVACAAGAYAAEVTFSAGDGVKNIIVTQTINGVERTVSRSFMKDATAPAVVIAAPADNTATKNDIMLSGTCESGIEVQIYGAGVAQPKNVVCSNGLFSTSVALSAGDGAKMVGVAQTDAAGNQTYIGRQFMKDSVAPALTITGPAAGTSGTSGLSLSGACETGLNVVVGGSGAAAEVSQACANGTYMIPFIFSNNNGTKSITATQTDAAGNATSVTRDFTRNSVGPAIAITAPAANTLARTGVTLQGTCTTGLAVAISGTGVSANSSVNCTNGMFSAAITFSAAEGLKNVVVQQTNASAQTGADSRSFMKDSVAPAINILSPQANASVGSSVTIAGTCESGLVVSFSGAGLAQPSNVNCTNGMFSSGLIAVSSGDGSKVLTATQGDEAGNVGTRSVTVVRDSTGPALTIASPAAGTSAATGLTIAGTCESGLNVNISGTGVASASSVACPSGSYSVAIVFSNGDGVKSVSLAQTDAAGNKTTVTRDFMRMSTQPVIDGPALYASNCATCHNSLTTSTKRGRTAAQITAAINGGVPAMASLSVLSSAQITAIANALAGMAPPPLVEKNCPTNTLAAEGGRRMNAREYINAMTHLMGNYAISKADLPADPKSLRDFDTDGEVLHILDHEADKYYIVANRVVEAAFATNVKPLFVSCSLDATQNNITAAQCFDQSLRKLISRAFRRAVTNDLVTKYTNFVQAETTPRAKMKLATLALLMSQDFLYVNVNAGIAAGMLTNLNSHQLAERLALLLWSSVPDETLMAAADANQLTNRDQMKAQITRMMADSKFNGFYGGFFDQWLKTEALAGQIRTPASFPDYSQAMLTSMGTETRTFLQNIISQKRPIDEIITADYSFVDSRLATYYGISGVTGTAFQRVTLPPEQRKGILTHGSILAVNGRDAKTTPPVRRGVFVLKKITCQPPKPPPPDIPSFPDDPASGAQITAKEKLARHRTVATCAGCHSLIDPPGIGLENFDNFGKWRTMYSPTLAVDATETINGQSFSKPTEMISLLAQQDLFKACVSETVASYTLGRVPSLDDRCHAENVVVRTLKAGGSLPDLISEFVLSDLFQKEIGD